MPLSLTPEGDPVILSGIYGGTFTPTEAAIVAVFYGLVIVTLWPDLSLWLPRAFGLG